MSITTNILAYIPQRAPFVMIDSLENCNNESASSTFVVTNDNIFVRSGNLTEPALIENIAQTAAARIGYLLTQQQPVPVRLIGAVEHLKISGLPQVGDILNTSVTIKKQIFNATIIEGKVSVGEREIVCCEMKIFTQG